jgi:CheY-like chemotaxis protein
MRFRILAVDDEQEILKVFRSFVEPLGCEVELIQDSREAARRILRQKFDAIFLDAHMPHLDGFELAKRIRSSPSNKQVPIAMLTAYDDAETMRKAFRVGVTIFLGKPFTAKKLRGLLRSMQGAMLKEKRRYARFPVRITIQCTWGGKTFEAASVNISEGGMLLEPSGGVAVGEGVSLHFTLPKAHKKVSLHACNIRKEEPDRMAAQFQAVTSEDQDAIHTYIIVAEISR